MLGLWLSKLQIRKCQREAFKFCLSPEIRHLSTVQIRFCGTKICNQNALPALLCLSHLSVSKDNCLLLHFQKITSKKGEEEEEVILLNTFCINLAMKVLAAFSWPIFEWSVGGSYAMCRSWCCHYAWSKHRAQGHWVDLAQEHVVLHPRWTGRGGCAFRYSIQLRGWHIWMCAVTYAVRKLRCFRTLRYVSEQMEYFRSPIWISVFKLHSNCMLDA